MYAAVLIWMKILKRIQINKFTYFGYNDIKSDKKELCMNYQGGKSMMRIVWHNYPNCKNKIYQRKNYNY